MYTSLFDLFKIGIGPSSSHTMGPMTAAADFVESLAQPRRVKRLCVRLLGSLAMTGRGHGTDFAVALGLGGCRPAYADPDRCAAEWARVQAERSIALPAGNSLEFDPERDIVFATGTSLPEHPNALTFHAFDHSGLLLESETYFSLGGGFISRASERSATAQVDAPQPPLPFSSGRELLELCRQHDLRIPELVWRNETSLACDHHVTAHLQRVLLVMDQCIDRGISREGELPGGLNVRRRAPRLHARLRGRNDRPGTNDPLAAMDWINLWAIAVNEENASFGRVVTAPTNGAAGIIPAVLRYYRDLCGGSEQGCFDFLLSAAAVGSLYKRNASISGAEVGCQGEVGVACSMAAAGLAAALGADNATIENAAEIGMEHNLGLTCDPIGGLVQIPCIERNAMGAMKAIDAARLAMLGDGEHKLSLDTVIATMRRTGADMSSIYKETSQGGLAVSYIEC